MCLSTVYEVKNPNAALAEYVTGVRVNGDQIVLTDIIGNDVTVRGGITNIDLVKNVITIDADAR
ncbi:MAG: CooT family nickel-binding protein [Clostridiales Family XIII bacterium]|jgi:predicted RNA-binding protein|nr:CooT family nickel-binding protein [Clostridiales Family XIII bacterium]